MYNQFLPLVLFGIATAFTPGPNNIMSSYSGFKNGSVYSSTKHAILGLSRAIHSELKEYNVRTFCISPGSTKTKMARKSIDQNYDTFLDPNEVANFIVHTISFDNEMVSDEIRLNRMVIE